MKTIKQLVVSASLAAVALGLTGCADMSRQDKNTAIGAAAGAVRAAGRSYSAPQRQGHRTPVVASTDIGCAGYGVSMPLSEQHKEGDDHDSQPDQR